ncbi:MAG: hypothetical protein Q8S24_01055 [Eubacteriales bacterium]|nr:hypothetical protein [Eubacteriales bacterium]
MINTIFWQGIVSSWVNIRSEEDIKKTIEMADTVYIEAIESRESEISLIDELMSITDGEDEDDD